MLGKATGRYSILGSTVTVNEYGDEIESDGVRKAGVLGSVIERNRSVYNPDDSRVATIRVLIGRFAYGTDIRDGDRIKDEKTGEVFVVQSITRGTTWATKPDVVVELGSN